MRARASYLLPVAHCARDISQVVPRRWIFSARGLERRGVIVARRRIVLQRLERHPAVQHGVDGVRRQANGGVEVGNRVQQLALGGGRESRVESSRVESSLVLLFPFHRAHRLTCLALAFPRLPMALDTRSFAQLACASCCPPNSSMMLVQKSSSSATVGALSACWNMRPACAAEAKTKGAMGCDGIVSSCAGCYLDEARVVVIVFGLVRRQLGLDVGGHELVGPGGRRGGAVPTRVEQESAREAREARRNLPRREEQRCGGGRRCDGLGRALAHRHRHRRSCCPRAAVMATGQCSDGWQQRWRSHHHDHHRSRPRPRSLLHVAYFGHARTDKQTDTNIRIHLLIHSYCDCTGMWARRRALDDDGQTTKQMGGGGKNKPDRQPRVDYRLSGIGRCVYDMVIVLFQSIGKLSSLSLSLSLSLSFDCAGG